MKCTFDVAIITVLCCLTAFPRSIQARSASAIIDNETWFEQELPREALGAHLAEQFADVDEEWIWQKLDHFNKSDTRMWKMRYFANNKYFVDGGPIFISLGGDGEILKFSLTYGFFHDIAKEHKGYLFKTEHRYYGESIPTADLATSNLKYLNAKQALADVAHFISTIKAENPRLTHSKIILAGAEYSGSLVVWFKHLYPELADGGWASSAPILAKMDIFEKKEILGETIRVLGSQQCYSRIQNGIAQLERMFATNRSGEAKALLNLSDDFDENNDLNVWSLFNSIAQKISEVIWEEIQSDILLVCDFLLSYDDDVTAMVQFVTVAFSSPPKYLPAFDPICRQQYYQSCNEFGWFPTSSSSNQPFGTKFPVTFFITKCTDLFGQQYSYSRIQESIEHTNELFGGLSPNVKNVYRTYGEFDLWKAVGYQYGDNVTVISHAFHRQDTGPMSSFDSVEVKAAKRKFSELVREWVSGPSP